MKIVNIENKQNTQRRRAWDKQNIKAGLAWLGVFIGWLVLLGMAF